MHRLVGGNESSPHSWPWTGQLVMIEGKDESGNVTFSHKCGCALIDNNFVVTAAHCFSMRFMVNKNIHFLKIKFSQIPSHYRVLLGGHQIFSGESHSVKSISIHPLYQNVQNAYDIALLRCTPNTNSFNL